MCIRDRYQRRVHGDITQHQSWTATRLLPGRSRTASASSSWAIARQAKPRSFSATPIATSPAPSRPPLVLPYNSQGVDFRIKIIKVKGKDVRLEIWDTGGQERYRTIAKSYYDRAMGVVLVYDCTDERSFGDIHNWMKQIEYHARPDIVSILVSSKCDLQDRRIDTESGKALAEELGIEFVETSAKMNVNVDKVFQLITEQIIEKDVSANPKNIKSVTVKKDTTNRSKKDKCC
eukprot:TRINITY_DN9753_c0_g1_i7.p1 TRINITY_DN9753_c0_g1~~TRINITY_DN9753_c0_g1_i7.p1  ORF type:complete len:233 (+),score=45.47 TRINITY_DN9753_c0_g1_i7:74-772(+)